MNKYPPPSDISFTSFHGLRIAAKRWGYVPDGGVLPSEDAAEDRNYIKILALHGWLDSWCFVEVVTTRYSCSD